MEKFVGKWLQIHIENGEELMKAKGVGFVMRKAAMAITPSMEIFLNEDKSEIRFLSVTKVKTFDVTLKVGGKDFEMDADPGASKSYTASCHQDAQDQFVILRSFKDGSGPLETITRSINGEGDMVQVNVWGEEVTSTRVWKRQS